MPVKKKPDIKPLTNDDSDDENIDKEDDLEEDEEVEEVVEEEINSDDEDEYEYDDGDGEEKGDDDDEEDVDDADADAEVYDETLDDEDETIDDLDDGDDVVIGEEEEDVESNAIRALDDERITPAILTKYEMIRIIGIRTKQLVEGAKPLVSDSQGKSPIRVALDELIAKKMPFKIKRQMPYAVYEIWKLRELTVNISQDEIDDLITAIM